MILLILILFGFCKKKNAKIRYLEIFEVDSWTIWYFEWHYALNMVPIASLFYPLKTLENLTIFWCFQGVEKGCIEDQKVKSFVDGEYWIVGTATLGILFFGLVAANLLYFGYRYYKQSKSWFVRAPSLIKWRWTFEH